MDFRQKLMNFKKPFKLSSRAVTLGCWFIEMNSFLNDFSEIDLNALSNI